MLTQQSSIALRLSNRASLTSSGVFGQQRHGKKNSTRLRQGRIGCEARSRDGVDLGPTRRDCLILCGVIWCHSLQRDEKAMTWAAAVENAVRLYRDPRGRYEISVPASWSDSEKPGAQVLFKNQQKASSNLGITINPVRVSSLEKFGSVEEIRERLLNAERQKDGFIDLQVLEQKSETIKQDVSYDIYIYELDTTRGKKRIVTGVTIDNFQLFIVNGQCKTDSQDDFERLKRAVTSFLLL